MAVSSYLARVRIGRQRRPLSVRVSLRPALFRDAGHTPGAEIQVFR